LIQIVASVVVVVLLLRLVQRYRQKQVSLRRFLFFGAVWLGSGIVVLWPEIADRVAAGMGLETATGIDFVVYVAVGVAFYMLFWLFVRLDRIERDLTTIVRHLALHDEPDE
jgi:hypothetical protein